MHNFLIRKIKAIEIYSKMHALRNWKQKRLSKIFMQKLRFFRFNKILIRYSELISCFTRRRKKAGKDQKHCEKILESSMKRINLYETRSLFWRISFDLWPRDFFVLSLTLSSVRVGHSEVYASDSTSAKMPLAPLL